MGTTNRELTLWERTALRRLLLWASQRGVLRWLLVLAAVVVTLPVLFYAVENWRGRSAWNEHRRLLETRGEKFDLPAVAPSPVPDAQNLAIAQPLKPLHDYTKGPSGLVWNDTNGLQQLKEIDWRKPGRRDAPDPSVGNLFEGSFWDLDSCRQFYLGNTNYPQAQVGANAAETILTALGRFDEILTNLRTAASSHPAARFPLHYDDEEPWGILLPHLAVVKGTAMVLDLRATALLELKQPDAALADWELALRLCDSIRDEPILISHLVRIAMLGPQLQVIREGLIRHAWTEAQLTSLGQRLASINLLAEYQHAIRGERALGVTSIDWARRNRRRSIIEFEAGGSEGPPGAAMVRRWMPGGWFHQNMVAISQFCEDHMLPAVDPAAHRVSVDIATNSDRAIGSLPRSPKNVFVRMFAPAVTKAVIKSAQLQTQTDMARVACAIERARLANGSLPDELGVLVPKFLERIPSDLIDGRTMRYRRNPDGGYVLYGVGWNGKDDGGQVAWTSGKTPHADPAQGDWVWKLPQ